MERVERFQTSDGILHKTEKEARRYCDEKMGNKLLHHAHKLASLEKFKLVLEYLEAQLPDFAEAERWRQESVTPLDEED